MRAALILAALLITIPAHAKTWQCWAYPKTCQAPAAVEALPVAPPVAPVDVAPVAVAPLPAPRPAAKRAPGVVTPLPSKVKRVKSKFAKPKRKAAVEWWCSYVPAGATEAQIIKAAADRNRVISHAQAGACLASKKG